MLLSERCPLGWTYAYIPRKCVKVRSCFCTSSQAEGLRSCFKTYMDCTSFDKNSYCDFTTSTCICGPKYFLDAEGRCREKRSSQEHPYTATVVLFGIFFIALYKCCRKYRSFEEFNRHVFRPLSTGTVMGRG